MQYSQIRMDTKQFHKDVRNECSLSKNNDTGTCIYILYTMQGKFGMRKTLINLVTFVVCYIHVP